MLERGLKLSHLYEEIIVINCDFNLVIQYFKFDWSNNNVYYSPDYITVNT